MQLWFIKTINEKEFEERKVKTDNIQLVAEQMCNEGKGVSFLRHEPRSLYQFFKLVEPYKNNVDYFEVSVIIDFHEDYC